MTTDLSDALYAWLNADADMITTVSGRIYPLARPQEATLPAVVYRLASQNPVYSQDGWTGRSKPVYQCYVHAASYSSGRDVVVSLTNALRRFPGWGDLVCERTFIETGMEGYMPELLEFRFEILARFQVREVV